MTKQKSSKGAMRVLFVCQGNTCRSPAAAELVRRSALEGSAAAAVNFELRTKGAAPVPNRPASQYIIAALSSKQLASYLAARVDVADLAWAHYVICIGLDTHATLTRRWPDLADTAGKRLILWDVEDPLSGSPGQELARVDGAIASLRSRVATIGALQVVDTWLATKDAAARGGSNP